MPTSPLQRVRLLFLTVALLGLLSAMLLTAAGGVSVQRQLVVAGAGLALGVHWTRGYRRGSFALRAELPEAVAVLAIVAACPGHAPVPLLGMLFRSLYGGPAQAALRLLGYGAALFAARELGAPATMQETVSRAVGIAAAAGVLPLLARSLAQLERTERRLRAIIRHADGLVLLAGSDLRVRWAGGAGLEDLGYDGRELSGRAVRDAMHPDDVAPVRSALHDVAATPGATVPLLARVRDADGRYRELEGSAANRLGDPDVGGLVLSFHDVTERRRLDRLRERVEAQRERQHLEAQLQRSRRLETVGRMAGGVAHDFNNLLAVMVNSAALAADELPASHPARADLAVIEGAAERGAQLVRHLLLFSQDRAGDPGPVDVNAAVRAVHALLGRTMASAVRLRCRPDLRLAPVLADESNLEQVLVNLVVNARDAVGERGTIDVTTANVGVEPEDGVELELPPGPYVRISVRDDGPGMDADTLARACEPFFTTKGPDKGTGLGLATVFGIVRQAGGALALDSAPGRGTTAHVYLPAAGATAAAVAEQPAPA